MSQSRITLDEYLALDNYSLELSGAFRTWLGNRANGKRTAGNWDRLMWQYVESSQRNGICGLRLIAMLRIASCQHEN